MMVIFLIAGIVLGGLTLGFIKNIEMALKPVKIKHNDDIDEKLKNLDIDELKRLGMM